MISFCILKMSYKKAAYFTTLATCILMIYFVILEYRYDNEDTRSVWERNEYSISGNFFTCSFMICSFVRLRRSLAFISLTFVICAVISFLLNKKWKHNDSINAISSFYLYLAWGIIVSYASQIIMLYSYFGMREAEDAKLAL